jgi:hypothetical protein
MNPRKGSYAGVIWKHLCLSAVAYGNHGETSIGLFFTAKTMPEFLLPEGSKIGRQQ